MTGEEAYWAGLGPEEMEFDSDACRQRDEAEAEAEMQQIERDSNVGGIDPAVQSTESPEQPSAGSQGGQS